MWGYNSGNVIVVNSFDVGLLVFRMAVLQHSYFVLKSNVLSWCRNEPLSRSVCQIFTLCSFSGDQSLISDQFLFTRSHLDRAKTKHLNVLYCYAGESQENIFTDNISFVWIAWKYCIWFHVWLMCESLLLIHLCRVCSLQCCAWLRSWQYHSVRLIYKYISVALILIFNIRSYHNIFMIWSMWVRQERPTF